jgi:CBS domain-containing protein
MKARDIMVSPVITVKPAQTVREVAQLFVERRISAAPVVDDGGRLVGIVSEGDLLRRIETKTERDRSSWLRLLTADEVLAAEYTKARARKVEDVMTKRVVVATVDTPLSEVAMLLEKNSIKRVPVVSAGRLVGIVSRSNLVQALATARRQFEMPLSDSAIRERLLSHLQREPWADTSQLNVTVNEGVVDIWGVCRSEAEREAVRVAAENVPGVRAVNNNLAMQAPFAPLL